MKGPQGRGKPRPFSPPRRKLVGTLRPDPLPRLPTKNDSNERMVSPGLETGFWMSKSTVFVTGPRDDPCKEQDTIDLPAEYHYEGPVRL